MKNKKSLGQNWLKDRHTLDHIAALAATPSVELCLEIGPGLGTLTSSLFKYFPKILAVEFDERLAQNLPGSFPGKDLQVFHQDFLQFNLSDITSPYVVAGNIPYYITSPIITKLLNETKDNPPKKIVLLVQKEVAERIAASVGEHTLMSILVQNSAIVELGPVINKKMFTPPPKVDSQVLILTPRPAPLINFETKPEILHIIKQGFSAPRKKLVANLPGDKAKNRLILAKLGLPTSVRPADLDFSDWKKLAEIKHNS